MFATLLGLAQPYFLKVLIDDAFLAQNFPLLVRVSLLLFAVSVVSVVLNAISGYRYIQVSTEALFDIRIRVFRHLQTLSPRFYAKTPMGDILSRLNGDVSEIQRIASDTLLSFLTNVVFLAGTVTLLIYLEPRLFLLSIALVPPSIWVLRRYRKHVTDKNLKLRERSADIGSFLVESFLGMRQTVARRSASGRRTITSSARSSIDKSRPISLRGSRACCFRSRPSRSFLPAATWCCKAASAWGASSLSQPIKHACSDRYPA